MATHPLAPPTITDGKISVDLMLQQPTRITAMLMDLTLQRFIADKIFTSGGGVTGGAVIHDVLTSNDLYADRDVEAVAPGTELPTIVTGDTTPRVAAVEKYGGKVWITDEARDRNDAGMFTRQMRLLANTVVRKINAVAVEAVTTAVSEFSRSIAGKNWATLTLDGNSPTPAAQRPTADFAATALISDRDEMGYEYDTWLINPQEKAALVTAYGANLAAVLASADIELFASNRVPAGTAFAVASQQVGEMRIEKPLSTETDRDVTHQRTLVQSDVRPVFVVTDPHAIVHVTGLAG